MTCDLWRDTIIKRPKCLLVSWNYIVSAIPVPLDLHITAGCRTCWRMRPLCCDGSWRRPYPPCSWGSRCSWASPAGRPRWGLQCTSELYLQGGHGGLLALQLALHCTHPQQNYNTLYIKLDWVGPVDNRPSLPRLASPFCKKQNKKKHVTHVGGVNILSKFQFLGFRMSWRLGGKGSPTELIN